MLESLGDGGGDWNEVDRISSRRRVWISGWRERRWKQYDTARAVVSEPANRNVESWSRISASDSRLEGSVSKFDLTVIIITVKEGPLETNQEEKKLTE